MRYTRGPPVPVHLHTSVHVCHLPSPCYVVGDPCPSSLALTAPSALWICQCRTGAVPIVILRARCCVTRARDSPLSTLARRRVVCGVAKESGDLVNMQIARPSRCPSAVCVSRGPTSYILLRDERGCQHGVRGEPTRGGAKFCSLIWLPIFDSRPGSGQAPIGSFHTRSGPSEA